MPNRQRHLRATIIYDKVTAAKKASAALQQAACCAKIATDWNIKPWSLDVLRLPSASDEALMETADADLIVLAGAGAYSFPSWLREWLECWANRRQVGTPPWPWFTTEPKTSILRRRCASCQILRRTTVWISLPRSKWHPLPVLFSNTHRLRLAFCLRRRLLRFIIRIRAGESMIEVMTTHFTSMSFGYDY